MVLALGLCANCVEKDARAPALLGALSVEASLGWLPPGAVAALRMGGGGGGGHRVRLPATALLCALVAPLLARMGFSGGEGGEEEPACSPDDVVLAAYLSLLLGYCLKGEGGGAVLLWVGRVLEALGGCGGGAPPPPPLPPVETAAERARLERAAASALSLALRAFVALQSSAGVLTEEALGHVTDVQAVLDARVGGAAAGWAAAGGNLERWLDEEDEDG